jgi:hypothetical protein
VLLFYRTSGIRTYPHLFYSVQSKQVQGPLDAVTPCAPAGLRKNHFPALNLRPGSAGSQTRAVWSAVRSRADSASCCCINSLCLFFHQTLESFDHLSVLGKGAFGKVVLSREKSTDALYAIKIVKKDFDKMASILTEKNVLQNTRHPFLLVRLSPLQERTSLIYTFCVGKISHN